MITGNYTVDRFEGNLAVLLLSENESIEVVKKRSELPEGTSEGDVLHLEFDSDKLISAEILKEETHCARKAAQNLLNKLKNK